MKRIYSISLNEKLIDELDKYCYKNEITRSEAISNLLVTYVANGVDPDKVEDDEIFRRKIMFLNSIFDLYFTMPEIKEFNDKFNIKLKKVEDNFSILFEFLNKKFICKLKLMDDCIIIDARFISSSSKLCNVFEIAYEKNRNELEQHGYKKSVYQRFWNIEYRHQVNAYPVGNEINILARFMLKKLLVLYANFLIELDFVIDKDLGEGITESLKDKTNIYNNILQPYLQVLIGEISGMRYKIESEQNIIIGRQGSDIDLTQQEHEPNIHSISNQHAQLTWNRGKLYIIDLGSTNGTWLNGKLISNPEGKRGFPNLLSNGDRILLADIELIFVMND